MDSFQEALQNFEDACNAVGSKGASPDTELGNSPDGTLQRRRLHIQKNLLLARQRLHLIKSASTSLVALID